MLLPHAEAFYGGAAGGGKSDALLMAALQYVDVPGYNALILRRTFKQLALPDAIMARSFEWLSKTDARWNGDRRQWVFPSGATLTFGHMEHEAVKYDYQGPQFHFVGYDELTQFSETMYTYLFSRMRRLKTSRIPTRMRSAANPGGIGHEWVKMRFVNPRSNERPFIPATMYDNPYINHEEYERNLAKLDPVTRKQLRDGDWDVLPDGQVFKREWFDVVDFRPQIEKIPFRCICRYWDMAASKPKEGEDPDYTVGTLVSRWQDEYYVMDVDRFRLKPLASERRVRQCAQLDTRLVPIYMEEEPGASGKIAISHYRRNVLSEFAFYGERSTGSKDVRANPFSSAAEAGLVHLCRGPWNREWLIEIGAFPTEGIHDDQVDSASGAYAKVSNRRTPSYTSARKR